MQNLQLLYDDSGAKLALSGGAYSAGLPIGNLLTDDLSEVARTVSVNPADTVIRVSMDEAYYVRSVVVGPGNFTPLMRYRIRGYDDAFGTPTVDTDWRYGVGGQYAAPIKWGEPNFWLRGNTGRTHLIHPFDQPQIARYWQIEIDDANNPRGYLDMGRLFMPMGWQPSINFSEGGGIAWQPNVVRQQTLSGGEIVRDRARQRLFTCAFDYLSEAEAILETHRLVEACGFSKLLFAIPSPDDRANMNRMSFFCRLQQADALALLAAGYSSAGFQLKEVI